VPFLLEKQGENLTLQNRGCIFVPMAKEVIYRCKFMKGDRCIFGNFGEPPVPSGASDTFHGSDYERMCMRSPSKIKERIVCDKKQLQKVTTEDIPS